MVIGSYVKYKDENIYVVIKFTAKNMVKILNPKTQFKLQVKEENVKMLNYEPMAEIDGYLVSRKGLIISLTSGRVMKWSDNHGTRLKLLRKAGIE